MKADSTVSNKLFNFRRLWEISFCKLLFEGMIDWYNHASSQDSSMKYYFQARSMFSKIEQTELQWYFQLCISSVLKLFKGERPIGNPVTDALGICLCENCCQIVRQCHCPKVVRTVRISALAKKRAFEKIWSRLRALDDVFKCQLMKKWP